MSTRDEAFQMRRRSRYAGGRLGGQSSSSRFEDDDFSPSEGIVNLADTMLVLACGLMMALLSFWNLDLSSMGAKQIAPQTDMTKIQDIQMQIQDSELEGAGYDNLGRVYQDPKTGQMYLLMDKTKSTTTTNK